ncbi:MAG: hypothetical protein H6724_18395 [Sandaracinus sp.]|nr:hypothetical protein [Sandaracinus sp.]
MLRTALLFCLMLPTTAYALPPGADAWTAMELGGIRGITVGPIESSQQRGPNGEPLGYGSEASEELLDHLVAMGANWISITPFGRIWALDTPEIEMDFEAPYEVNRQDVKRMIRAARARGLRVLLIPHLWVETTGWRGEIDFETPAQWARYQESYRRFVLAWARDAAEAGADALSIGVECKSWSGRFGGYWTRLIGEIRAVFPGWLTYSANWDEAENVLFWDQLDFVGINAFYPLASEDDATDATYAERAAALVPSLRELAEVLQMPILFVEVGYTTRANAAVQPWLWPDGMEGVVIDEREQARALAASFDAFLPEDFFAGFFVWRYYARLDDVSQEAFWGFSTHAKMAEPMLVNVFEDRWGSDPAPWPWEPSVSPRLPVWHPKSWMSPTPPLGAFAGR